MFPTILIVDDEESILQSLSGLLLDEGFEVITANNGYEALKMIDAESPDLVLLDIWMPGIDGIALCERIVTFRPDVPVVVVTAFGSMETAIAALRAGAYDFLPKPFTVDALTRKVRSVLDNSQGGD